MIAGDISPLYYWINRQIASVEMLMS